MTSASHHLESYLTTSFVDDLSYQPPCEQQPGMRHTLVTGRRTWKTLREKREAVWPPFLEAALFDALEKYQPTSSGDPRLLRRFPKRNKYISGHILRVTGKVRTPKQVGSRLQQLRDTCQEEKVLKLLSRRDFSRKATTVSVSRRERSGGYSPISSPLSVTSSGTPSELSLSSVSSPSLSDFPTLSSVPSPVLLALPELFSNNVDLSPADLGAVADKLSASFNNVPAQTGSIDLISSPIIIEIPQNVTSPASVHIAVSYPPCTVAPTIIFSSPAPISSADHHSFFCIFLDGRHIHSEVTTLVPLPGIQSQGGQLSEPFFYQTSLVPRYWSELCAKGDLSKITITQDVMRVPCALDTAGNLQDLLSVIYDLSPTSRPQSSAEVFCDSLPHQAPPGLDAQVSLLAPKPVSPDALSPLLGFAPSDDLSGKDCVWSSLEQKMPNSSDGGSLEPKGYDAGPEGYIELGIPLYDHGAASWFL